jgi:hypothetical protein
LSQATLTDNQVLAEVRRLVRIGKIRWKDHAEIRMAERGYERGQVKQCLLSGRFNEALTVPNNAGDLQYVFKISANIDGMPIDVVASLYPEARVVVITVI